MSDHDNGNEGGMSALTTVLTLTTTEQYELRGHEQVIERGLATFYEVGTALLAIRDKRLYRATHGTFEDYCEQRWSIKHSRANQLMDAAEIMNHLSTIGGSLPSNERQARELARLSDVDQVLAWKVIADTAQASGGKVTAGYVKAIAETLEEMRDTGYLTLADEAAIPTSEIFQARLTEEVYEIMERQREHISESQKRKAHVANASGEFEWYTPEPYIEAARSAMGSIDCDPATTVIANQRVKAQTIFTLENSGLDFANTWDGNVWLNPPYALGIVDQFTRKLVDQVGEGRTEQACVLVNNATETEWFQEMLPRVSAICLVRGRINYLTPSGEPLNKPLQGQIVLYFGHGAARFQTCFRPFGVILQPSEERP